MPFGPGAEQDEIEEDELDGRQVEGWVLLGHVSRTSRDGRDVAALQPLLMEIVSSVCATTARRGVTTSVMAMWRCRTAAAQRVRYVELSFFSKSSGLFVSSCAR